MLFLDNGGKGRGRKERRKEERKEGERGRRGREEEKRRGEERKEREGKKRKREKERERERKNPTQPNLTQSNPNPTSRSMPPPNPRKHRLTCNLSEEELTRFKANRARAGHHSDSAYLRDQALMANPTRALDKDWERAFLQGHVELAGAIDRGDLAGALKLSKELIGRIVR